MKKYLFTLIFAVLLSTGVKAQDNYEIQVYGSETVDPGRTMVELHSNYTANGFKTVVDSQLPDNHEVHETVEITHGWMPWFETGFYFFNSIGSEGQPELYRYLRPVGCCGSQRRYPDQIIK